ncbi:threonylcarbamoyl-AMP synthase [Roseovarius sp. LXJ103]|uniref:L-threonylcarbamoyladenylate synthase n=1 Tax=Roseovarius carneus TaxID=2853164 RepID=UPI000D6073D6|nr:L-threonylcarbamoyladenylate synthase [Roseovarius carneus]MBZ8118180.1 threonylcarbamoyl-AMP synthase [Roseovarius carneus]PWE36090.1 threonylcarbamoyl-AMP synthase [Pelagicola sp. LXJ1103]
MHTLHLRADIDGITRAATLLQEGGLVAFPTETVYGLGADATNGAAVASVYAAKGRPAFNPLIVHVASIEDAQRYALWSDAADRLATLWPGPLTLVLPRKPASPLALLTTAGLDSVALRIPAHPVARALLATFGGPLAAPSANPSGRISPTTAAHVADGLTGRIDAIIDGGACSVGLESTILGLTDQNGSTTLLRPGGLPQSVIEAALGAPLTTEDQTSITAPGQLASHYAPNASLRLNATDLRPGETLLGFGPVANATLNLSPGANLTEAAANLFDHLHQLDAAGPAKIAVSPIPDHGLGHAINDRLRRAAAPRDQ